jgi:hypothetical protein
MTILLLSLAGLLYVLALAFLGSLRGGDAWSNGWAQVAAVFALALEWLLLGALAVKAQRLTGAGIAAAGALAGFLALRLLDDGLSPPRWPLVLAAAGPLVVALLVARRIGAAPAALAVGALAAIGLGTVAVRAWRGGREREAAGAAQRLADRAELARLDAGAPVEAWLRLAGSGSELRPAALAGARSSPRRQQEVEELLAWRSSLVLGVLPELDVRPTPRLCEAARRALRGLAVEVSPLPERPAQLDEDSPIQGYRAGLRWLVEGGCDCRAELDGLAAAVARYPETPARRELEAYLAELRAAPREPPRRR